MASFSCRTEQVIPAGDHIILLGLVKDHAHVGLPGLGYAAGQYVSIGLERRAAAASRPGRKAVVGAIIRHEDRILLEETDKGFRPPQLRMDDRAAVRPALEEHLAGRGLAVTLGAAYSIFDDRPTGFQFTYFLARADSPDTGGIGTFVPIADLAGLRFVSEGHATMLARYALEDETQNFALYVGDESGGDIHSLQQGS